MKKAILISLISLAAFTSVISADIKPAQASGNGVVAGVRGAYNSAQDGDPTGIFIGLFIVIAAVANIASNSK